MTAPGGRTAGPGRRKADTGGDARRQPADPNIVLIGMPGCGKSTIGVLLAKRLARDFLDTDLIIQVRRGQTLQEIIEREGPLGFRRVEARVLLDLRARASVIATGGSAVYSPRAMARLGRSGHIVFLHVPLPELERRLGDFGRRGVALLPGQTLSDLYRERLPLYRRYAQRVVDCRGCGHDGTLEAAVAAVAELEAPGRP